MLRNGNDDEDNNNNNNNNILIRIFYIIIFTYNLRVLLSSHMKLSAYKQQFMCSLYVGLCFEDTYHHIISGFSIKES